MDVEIQLPPHPVNPKHRYHLPRQHCQPNPPLQPFAPNEAPFNMIYYLVSTQSTLYEDGLMCGGSPPTTIPQLCEIIKDENKNQRNLTPQVRVNVCLSVFVSIVIWYNIFSFQADIRVA